MWNKLFEHLRRRMTCIYAAIFGVLILLLVFGAYIFIWWEIVDHEKHELVEKVYHEAEEWVDSGEEPCSAVSIQEGSMLAYFVTMDDKMVILNQLGDGPQGRALWHKKWIAREFCACMGMQPSPMVPVIAIWQRWRRL